MVFRNNKLLTIILALGVIGAACALANRHAVEMRNRAVEIAVDYSEVAEVAGASGVSVPKTLSRLKSAGVTSVAVQEETVADLVGQGVVRVYQKPGGTGGTTIEALTPDAFQLLRASGFDIRRMSIPANAIWTSVRMEVPEEPEFVLTRPLGLPQDQITTAKKAGLVVVARLVNYPGVKKPRIEKMTRQLKREGIRTVIFGSDQVLGFRGSVDDVAEAFKSRGLVYGSIEFSKQKGDQRFSELMKPDVVRVHSVSSAEMGGLDEPSAVERFVRAAKERNIRLMYVRMFDRSASQPLDVNLDYVTKIASGLSEEGFRLKQVHPFEDPAAPLAARVLIALGVAAGVMLMILSIFTLRPGQTWLLFAVFAVLMAAMVASGFSIGTKLVALGAAIAFPALAVLNAAAGTSSDPTGKGLRATMFPAIGRFVSAVAVSAAGGLMIAGLLSSVDYMLRINQFAGVKLAHIAPILLVATAFIAGIGWKPGTWNEQKEKAIANVRTLAAQPVLFWQTAIAFVLLVMVGLLLARSGNDPGVGVSPLELKLRAILDTLLYVRPRTKEFLIGHPALFLGIAAALAGRRNWAAVLIVIGMFGEVSLINTFCHIHTPIAISVLRSVIGATLGLAIGVVLLLLFSRSEKGLIKHESTKLHENTKGERELTG